MSQFELFNHTYEFHYYRFPDGVFTVYQFFARGTLEAVEEVVAFVSRTSARPWLLFREGDARQIALPWERFPERLEVVVPLDERRASPRESALDLYKEHVAGK
jgi:hypothetical protein